MDAISASTVRVTTMADGTLRLVVDIEPASAKDAFGLFGAPGTAVALAALIPEHKREKTEEVKGGPLARLAGMWCKDERFLKWGKYESEDEAASAIRFHCFVETRAQLDNSKDSAELFEKYFRKPFMEYLRETDAGSDGF